MSSFSDVSIQELSTGLLTQISPQITPNKITWKPSELEVTVLKMHFRRNKFPTSEEKGHIIEAFQSQFHSQITQVQLTRWFQNERKKVVNKMNKEPMKSVYRKFEKDELELLHLNFSKDNYPSMNDMSTLAEKLSCSFSKIENWFKHNRRAEAKQGNLKLKTKKYFKKDELSILSDYFDEQCLPTLIQYEEMAQKLNCSLMQIKNWFANRRKKMKLRQKNKKPEQPPIIYQVSGYDTTQKLPSAQQFYPSNLTCQFSAANEYISQSANSNPYLSMPSNFVAAQPMPAVQTTPGLSLNHNPTHAVNSNNPVILYAKNPQQAYPTQHATNINTPFCAGSTPAGNCYLGAQNNIMTSNTLQIPNNSIMQSSPLPTVISLNQANTRLNQPVLQQPVTQNMTVLYVPCTYITVPTVSNLPLVYYGSQNNQNEMQTVKRNPTEIVQGPGRYMGLNYPKELVSNYM